jgi:hypothetical protein
MIKDSAEGMCCYRESTMIGANVNEERIMQTGKKKLVLDHLIVQKMDDDDPGGDDVQSILTHGAQTLFNEDADQNRRDITCE